MNNKKTRRKKMKLKISKTKYNKLISLKKGKKKISLKDRKLLDDALYVKYCKCYMRFEPAARNIIFLPKFT